MTPQQAYKLRHRDEPWYKKRAREYNRIAYRRNPDKILARNVVWRSVRDGKLAKPVDMNCTDCDKPAEEYDHFNGYDKDNRLNVEAVCIPCHAARERARV